MEDIIVSAIDHKAPQYQQVWNVREEILRKPLGRSLKDDDLSRDLIDTIFIAEHKGKVIGCVLLHRIDAGQAQLRAMAVYNEWQGKGVGRLLVQAAEQYAIANHYHRIILHARKVAVGFYSGMGYNTYGDEFTEVGIPHFMMEKNIGGGIGHSL
ncbi:MAG: family N-acetyltransferase [Flavipsychrobacter sp.]|nr:family N-acetyltransferase [Flavipsychrobacter sp.]